MRINSRNRLIHGIADDLPIWFLLSTLVVFGGHRSHDVPRHILLTRHLLVALALDSWLCFFFLLYWGCGVCEGGFSGLPLYVKVSVKSLKNRRLEEISVGVLLHHVDVEFVAGSLAFKQITWLYRVLRTVGLERGERSFIEITATRLHLESSGRRH